MAGPNEDAAMLPTAATPPTRRARAKGPARRERERLPRQPRPPMVHASEAGGGAGAGAGAAAAEERRALFPSLATLLAGHLLRDGEVVLLILKPSAWFILFSVMRFVAAVSIAVIAANLWL